MDQIKTDILSKVSAYLDKEMSKKELENFEKKLDNSKEHQQFLAEQKLIKQLVNDNTPFVSCPGYLRTRIQRAIDRESDTLSFKEILASLFTDHSLKMGLVTAMLILAVIFPYFGLTNTPVSQSRQITEIGTFTIVKGQLICLDCDYLTAAGVKGWQHTNSHRAALKAEDGTVWHFLDSGKGSELLHKFELSNQSIQITGTSLPESHFFAVDDYKKL